MGESAVHTLHAEIDDALAQAKGSEEKAKRAMVDAARLADELRAEQDHTGALEKGKAALTATMAELELNLGQANEVAAKGGRTAMAKLETRIRELELELGAIQAKIENYKHQIAEAEEIAALNLAKFRKAQQDVEANEERAKAAGAALLA